jgi:hypothetical protein
MYKVRYDLEDEINEISTEDYLGMSYKIGYDLDWYLWAHE